MYYNKLMVQIVRLISSAAQKFISDVAYDALQVLVNLFIPIFLSTYSYACSQIQDLFFLGIFIHIFLSSYSYSCIQIQDLFFYAYLYFFSCQVILIQIQDLFFLGIFNIHLYLGRAASIPSLIYHTSWLSYVQSELNT